MTETQTKSSDATGASHLIDAIEETERSTLESVRKFVDEVNGAFPDISDDSPRQKIIDSAFKMVEQLVGASNKLAQNIVDVTGDALEQGEKTSSSTK
jgi:tetrahydromethanopterin S-methyltransferase subunit H